MPPIKAELPGDMRSIVSWATLEAVLEAAPCFCDVGNEARAFVGSRMVTVDVTAGIERQGFNMYANSVGIIISAIQF